MLLCVLGYDCIVLHLRKLVEVGVAVVGLVFGIVPVLVMAAVAIVVVAVVVATVVVAVVAVVAAVVVVDDEVAAVLLVVVLQFEQGSSSLLFEGADVDADADADFVGFDVADVEVRVNVYERCCWDRW